MLEDKLGLTRLRTTIIGVNRANLNWPGIQFYSAGQLLQQTQTIDQYDADVFIGTDNVNITKDFAMNGFVGAGSFYVKGEDIGVLEIK